MNAHALRELLIHIREGKIDIDEGVAKLRELSYVDLGCAKLDTQRELRVGYPEVVYCPGKTTEQVTCIVRAMVERNTNVLATRASEALCAEIRIICPDAVYHPQARAITIKRRDIPLQDGYIAVVTAEFCGNRVERIVDVGVAGIHRLFDTLDIIRNARVIIVVAGMEGALPSIIGGLVDVPVIAVPTSVGYGASFHGISALLTMLNSCASGVAVVNIDNGFGAGYMASVINRRR